LVNIRDEKNLKVKDGCSVWDMGKIKTFDLIIDLNNNFQFKDIKLVLTVR
jgi:hypothetical protein